MKKTPKEFWEDMRWGQAHKSELMEKYKGEWVAIVNKKVVASGNNLGKVEEEAMKITRANVANSLDGLPTVKMHCSNLAADGLHEAIKDYLEKKKGKK